MDRLAIALVLEEIGSLLELTGENRFKARAFRTAARALEKTDADVRALARENRLQEIAGIGPATARVIRELVEVGQSRYYAELRERTPSGLRELLNVPGLGASKIQKLHEALGIENVADLERAVQQGQVARVKGFGEKTQERIARGITFARGSAGRRRVAQVLDSAARILGYISALDEVTSAEIAGELRRRLEIVSSLDIVTSAADDLCDVVLAAFRDLPGTRRTDLEAGGEACVQLADGLLLRLWCVPRAEFATRLLFATGSDTHLELLCQRARECGLRLAPDGLHRGDVRQETWDEEAVYAALALQYVPPELREDGTEVGMAADHLLPRLVELEDLYGCFHCHTSASDGTATVAEMAESARARGWRYLGIADHSPAAYYAGGLTREQIERQHDEIDEWNERHGTELWLFKGIEADILADGTVDLAESGLLARFDYVVASVHSQFRMPREQMTARVLRALEDPHVTMLGHATGRLLLHRDGYALDVDAVIARAAERGVLIEINADPHRLDLDWRHWPKALASGVRTAINPDAHSARGMDAVEYGVYMARKGGLTREDVLNAWPLERVRAYLEARKP